MEFTFTKPIVFFDVESTGLDTVTDRIVSISAYKLFPDRTFVEKTTLVKPMMLDSDKKKETQMPIPSKSTDIHGITDEMVKDAPTFRQISKSLNEFFDGCDIGGFNNNHFDNQIIVEEFSRCNIQFPKEGTNSIDVGILFKIYEPRTLQAAMKFYCNEDFKEDAHDSQNDTRATVKVFFAMLKRKEESLSGLKYEDLNNKTVEEIHKDCLLDKNTIDFLQKISIDEDGDLCFNFGREKGKKIKKYKDYADWVLKNSFAMSTKFYIRKVLSEQN